MNIITDLSPIKEDSLVLGNCYEVLSRIPDNSVDLVVTDPPYDLSINHDGGQLYKNKKITKQQEDIVDSNLDLGYDIKRVGNVLTRIMKDINIYIWCNKTQIPDYFDFYVKELECKFDIICWHKTNALPTYSNKYLTDTEYLLYFHKGKGKCKPQCYEDAKTYYLAPINNSDKALYKHPTIKPLDITERIIRNSSVKGDTVLDCFMGSGTTGVACKNLDRRFIGIELNKEYFEIACNRITGESNSTLLSNCTSTSSLW